MSGGTLKVLTYTDPWGITTPATVQTGVVVQTDGTPPSGTVLAACLVEGRGTHVIGGVGLTSHRVRLHPRAPLSPELSYEVWIQWVPSGSKPTWPVDGMITAALVVSVPTLTSVQITGTPGNPAAKPPVSASTSVNAAWAFGGGAGGNAGGVVHIFSSAGVQAGYIMNAGSTGSSAIALQSGTQYTAYVQAVQPALAQLQGGFAAPYALGPYSAPIPVTVDAPVITTASFDGTTLSVAWTPVDIPTSPIPVDVGYTLYLLDGTTVMAQWPATAGGAVVPLGLDLRAIAAPTVAGAVRFGPVQAPWGTTAALITAAPAITGATVASGGGSVTVTVAPPAGLPTGATVTVALLANGAVATSGTATATGSVTLNQAMAEGTVYALTAYATLPASGGAAAVTGPAVTLPFAPGPVTGLAAGYDGQNLSLTWTPLADAALTGYQVSVTVGAAVTTVTTADTSLLLPIALAPQTAVSATVCPVSGVALGAPGSPLAYTVPTPSTPSIVQCDFDGTAVTIAWTPSTGPGVTGYAVTLTGMDDGGDSLTASYSTGLETFLSFPLPAGDTVRTWTVTAAPVAGGWTGTASAEATVYTATPVIKVTTVTGATSQRMTVSATWRLAGRTGALLTAMHHAKASLQWLLLADGEPAALQPRIRSGAKDTVSLILPAGGDDRRLALSARVIAASASGPRSRAAPLLAIQPSVTSAAYDGTWLSLAWTGVAEGTTGHTVILTPSSGTSITFTAGAEPSLVVPATLSPGATWGVTVQPFGPGATGPVSASANVTLPVLSTPVVTLTRYEQGVLTVAWTAAATSATYVVTVTGSAGAVAAQETAGLGASIPVSLAAGGTYTVSVQPWLGSAQGTASAAAAILTTAPDTPTATTAPATGTTTVGWAAVSNATGYLLRLGAEGASAAVENGTSATVTISPGAPLTAAVAAEIVAGSLTTIGPFSVPLTLPTEAPVVTSAAFAGTSVVVEWTPVSAATGYTATVLSAGAQAGSQTVTAPTTTASVTVTMGEAGATYTVVVQAVFGASTGPLSAALPLLVNTFSIDSSTFDGESLALSVTAPTGTPAPDGYDVVLLHGGEPVQTAAGLALADGTLTLPVTVPVDAAAAYSVSVAARAGAASTAGTATVLLAAPQVTGIVATVGSSSNGSSGSLAVTADLGPIPGAGVTMQAVLYTDGAAGTPVSMTNGAATLPLGTSGTTFAVAVGAQVGTATGPWSAPVPAVTTAPTSLAASYANGTLAAAWTGGAGGSYQLSILSVSTTVAEASVAATSGEVPFAATAGTAYTLSIVQVAGVAAGPAATLPLVTDGCVISSVSVDAGRTATVTWQAPANPSTIAYVQPVIAWGGVETALSLIAFSTSPLTLILPAWVPNGAALTLQALAGGATGPGGSAAPLLTTSPTGLQIAFADDSIQAAWDAAPGAEVDGYSVTLTVEGETSEGETPTSTSTPIPVSGLSTPIPYTPGNNSSATVSVAATSGSGTGPASAALPVITAAPTLGTATFDGRTLTLTVTAPAGTTPTGYDVVLLRDGEAVQSATGLTVSSGALSFPVEIPVDPAGAYSVSVNARTGTSTGPAGTATVLLAAPQVTGIVATVGSSSNGSSGSLAVTADLGPIPGAGVTMQAVLYTDGVAGTPVSMTNGAATLPLGTSGTTFAVAVGAQVGDATGPWSAPVPAVTTAPTSLTASYANGTLAAAWSGGAGGSYQLSILSGSSTVVEASVAATSGEVPFAAAAGTAYTLSIVQAAGVATGPAATLPLVTDGCVISSVSVDAGRTATVTWQAPANPSTIGYVQPVIAWGGVETALSLIAFSTGPLTLTLPAWVPNGAALTLQALAGGATGPGGSAAPLLTTSPTGLQIAFADDSIQAAWDAAPGAEVDGYAVTLTVAGASPTSTPILVSGLSTPIHYTPGNNSSATVSVAATSGSGTGPASAAVPVITAAPTITSAVYDGTSLTLQWTAAAGANATATLVSLLTGGVVTEQVMMGGTEGSIALPPGPWAVRVQAAGAGTVGPPPTPDVTLLTAPPPVFTSVGWDALDTACTVGWQTQAGVGAYTVAVTNGGIPVTTRTGAPAGGAEEMTLAISADLFSAEGSYALSICTQDAAQNPVAVGPWGPSIPVVAAPPTGVSVAYDGATATVSWNPVASPLVTGYQVSTIVQTVSPPTTTTNTITATTATSASFSLAAVPASPATIVVQALFGPGVGPPSVQVPVLAQGLFLSTGSGVTPSLAPGTTPSPGATDLVLYLPQIFQTPPAGDTLPTAAPFEMAAAPTAAPAGFAYTLTIPATSEAWQFDSASRQAVQTAYTALLTTLAGQTATPLGLRTVQDAISRAMPQTFTETLYYAYGLNPAQGWVDLRPGMVLRVEYEAYQAPGGQAPDGAYVAGYVASGTAEYEIASYLGAGGQWLTGFDAFLATLAAANGISVLNDLSPDTSGRAQGAGGVIDAFFTQFQQPFCRIVYPATTLGQNSTGSAYPYDNPVLLASNSLADLHTAAAALRGGTSPSGNVAYFYFRGRTTLTACVRVLVNGAPMLVPVGTTVGNLLASLGARPPVAGLPLSGVALLRPFGAAVLGPGAASGYQYPVGAGWNVRLDWSPGGTYGASSDWLDLPLLHGDQLSFGGQ